MSNTESKLDGLLDPEVPQFNWVKEILAGLTVSFVAISLGAAFGVMSGRGALSGILSAGVIALLTAAFGGTRIQCSGPTAPMTAVMLLIVAAVGGGVLDKFPGVSKDHFLNMVLILTGLILIVAAITRLGKFIQIVPKVVISGFMNGIAVLIWVGEGRTLLGLKPTLDQKTGAKITDAAGEIVPRILEGGIGLNCAVALVTLILCFVLPPVLKRLHHSLSSLLPTTLVVIVAMTAIVNLFGIPVEKVTLGGSLSSFADLSNLVTKSVPTDWSLGLIWLALPFALNLAMLAYLDTLLTSLVVDKKVQGMFKSEETTKQNKELAAQGVANAVVAFLGGIPGAQATIRSVLILNEGAMTRIAGVLVGVFVIVEMVILQDLISMIPIAVFSGVLFKVGYDVFDWRPLVVYFRELRAGSVPDAEKANLRAELEGKPAVESQTGGMVTHMNIFFILGTTLVTVLVNLNVAVVAFSVLFYVIRSFRPIHDLMDVSETEGFDDED